MKTERVIRVHFTGRDSLQLSGDHVPTFIENYQRAVGNGNYYFFTKGKDSILINIPQVTFIEETTIEIKDERPTPTLS